MCQGLVGRSLERTASAWGTKDSNHTHRIVENLLQAFHNFILEINVEFAATFHEFMWRDKMLKLTENHPFDLAA
jgi:hypothetical protein